nr:hypothetical protein [uncultured Mediterranean phage uvMED]|tara:strand:+ start:23 stop:271 length:249 start_codon:yes stop_codon:yes gene_type:complete
MPVQHTQWQKVFMDLIILNDGMYSLVLVTKEMIKGVQLLGEVDCFDLCDILRLHLTTYYDYPINAHVMKDGTGDLFGCICSN